jgi:putative solute:sodium symporter small subunit
MTDNDTHVRPDRDRPRSTDETVPDRPPTATGDARQRRTGHVHASADGDPASRLCTDGGAADSHRTDGGRTDVEREREIDYLDVEINLLNPATPFMRDHLRVIWIGFGVWALTTFGPITATAIAPDAMTTTLPVIGFPFHYFAIAIGGPTAALLLSVWYARRRDRIDEKYGIVQPSADAPPDAEPDAEPTTAVDGGVEP